MTLHEITIEVTQRCPNKCIYCSSLSDATKTQYLDYETICRVVDDAKSLGAKSVSLSGGEPFLHSDIVKIAEYINLRGMTCLLYSSGIVLSKDGTPASVPADTLESIKGKVSKLIVNIEAADETTYNHIMGTSFGGFELMQDSVRKAIKAGITVEAHVVPMKLNIQQLPKIMALCDQLGVSRVSFLRLVVQGRAYEHKSEILLSEDDVVFAKNLVVTHAPQYQGAIRFGIPFGECTHRINCMTGTSKLDIRYDGKVYPCEAFKDMPDGINAPDSIYEKRLSEIYINSAYLNEIRRQLDDFQQVNTCECCMNQYYRKQNERR